MRVFNWAVVFALVLSLAVLGTVKYSQKNSAASTENAAVKVVTGSGSPVLVSLPSFAPLVKRDGPAVVNISTTQKISVEPFQFPGFPVLIQAIRSTSFFVGSRPAVNIVHTFAILIC